MVILLHIGGLLLIGLVAWWLSRYDSPLAGNDQKPDLIRRGIRCAATLILVEILFWVPPAVLGVPIILAVIWAGCLAELATRAFRFLIDPEDQRGFDPRRNLRELDAVAGLIRSGKKAEAVRLCRHLQAAGEVDVMALELPLEHLGLPAKNLKPLRPLVEAARLRQHGKAQEAAVLLRSLLAKNPRNLEAALMLVRVYTGDLRQPDRAQEVLRALEQQPDVSADHLQQAYRSMAEWGRPPTETAAAAPPESIAELVVAGRFGTAVERLEAKIRERPEDFTAWLTLAEIHGGHCHNLPRAAKIIRQIELNPDFSPEQIALAGASLKIWRAARKPAT